MKKTVLFLLSIICVQLAFAQVTLTSWTFPTGTSSDSLPGASLAINSGFGFRTGGSTSAINWTTNGVTNYCAQATGWDNGMSSKYWSIRFYSTGYHNLTISAAIRSGGTYPGPRDFKAQYRILPDLNWTDVPNSNIVAANNWTSGVLINVSLPATLDNQSGIIEMRLVMTSNTNSSGGALAANGICKIDNVSIAGTLMTGSISGTVTYNNSMHTQLRNVNIDFLSNGNIVTSTVTDTLGQYAISNLAAGTYHVKCSSTASWGGANSVDALLALRYFVGLSNLTGLYFKAADVNNSGFINASDALDISKRFTGLISSFTVGDWVFEEFDVVVTNGTVSQNISGLCTGDVNGSFVPTN